MSNSRATSASPPASSRTTERRVEPHRTVAGSVASEVVNSIRQNALIPPGMPKHGWEKGSYRSPFEYYIPGHTVGSKATASRRFISHASSPSITSFTPLGSMTPAADTHAAQQTQAYEMESSSESDSSGREVMPGLDAKERLVLLGPLRMMRAKGFSLHQDDRVMLFTFLDSYMADSLHTIVERDDILPNIVYRVSIPMTDTNWSKYCQLLAVFEFASGIDAMLAVGADAFDNYTYKVDGTSAEHVQSWKVLASARERNLAMESLSKELVQVWKGMWAENGAGYVGPTENVEQ